MYRLQSLLLASVLAMSGAVQAQNAQAEVFAAERAFAKSMADRDLAAFGRLLAQDTLFFGSARRVHRGRDAHGE